MLLFTPLSCAVDFVVATIGAISGARTDSLICGVMKSVVDRLLEAKEPANHDLQLAVRRSYLQAILVVCDKCIDNLSPYVSARELNAKVLLSSDENIEAIDQLKSFRKLIITRLRMLNSFEYSPPSREAEQQFELLLQPTVNGAQLSATLRQNLTSGLVADIRTWQRQLPEQFVTMIEKGWDDFDPDGNRVKLAWFDVMCAFFVNYLKTDQNVQHIFTDILLSKMALEQAITLEMLESKWEEWGKPIITRLEEVDAHLEELRQEQRDKFVNLEDRLDELIAAMVVVQGVEERQKIMEDRLNELIRLHDLTQSDAEKKALILDYLKVEREKIETQLLEDLGEGNRYVEPLIEMKTKEVETENATDKPLGGETDSFTPVDPNTYFTEGPEDKIVVVADSGYGKSTLLKEIFIRISKSFETKPFGIHSFIPIFLTPSQAAECSETNIENKIRIRLIVSGCREGKVRQLVQDEFGRGNFVFLIDALDQVISKENLRGALGGSAFGKNRVVITVRPNVWKMEENHLRGYTYVRLREFDQNRWQEYLGKERLVALREVVDQDFLSVPMFLKLVVESWQRGMKKTERVKSRAGLYSNMFNRLLERPEDRDAAEALTKDPRNPLDVRDDLRKLAHDALAEGYLGQLPRSYAKKVLGENKLKDLEARRGILRILETEEEIAFRHRSFQEYLAAEYLKSNIKHKDDLNKIEPYLYHPNWEESMRFLAGLLDPKSAEYLVDMILNAAKGRLLFLYRDHLRIASLCLREMVEAGESQRETIIEELRKDLHDPVLQNTAISILATFRDKRAVEIVSSLLLHKDDSVRWSAADALGKIRSEKSIEALIQALQDEDDSVRWSAADALGKIGSEKAVETLIQALKDEDAYVREIAADALGKIGSEKAVEPLIQALKDEHASVRRIAADTLGKIGSEKTVEALIQALKDEHASVRWTAADALGKIGSEKSVEVLIQALKDEHASVRGIAADALGKIGSERAVEVLIQALKDEDASVRGIAADTLGKIGSEKSIEALIQALKDEDASVRGSAAGALGVIRSEKASEALIQTLQDEDTSVRWAAATALGKIGCEKAVGALIQALQNKDASVRWTAADALGKIESEKSVEALIHALRDKVASVRWNVAVALGKIGSEKAVEALIQALQDEDDSVRWSAADALGKIESEKSVEALIHALRDKVASVRRRAADTLGKIGSERAVEALIQALQDEDAYIRRRAAGALSEIRSEKVLKALIQALKDKDASVRRIAAVTLSKIGSEKSVEALIRALQDEDAYIREIAADALGKIGSEKAVEPLIQALKDEHASVRRIAADTLGKIGSEKSVEALIQTLQDEDTSVRRRVAGALSEIGSEKALKALIQALKDKYGSVRRIAAVTLGKIGSRKYEEALIQALKDGDPYIREIAADALGKIRSEKAVEALIQALRNKATSVRGSAADALGKIGSEKAVEPLIQALQDKNPSVRESAAESLRAFDVSRIKSILMDMWHRESPVANRSLLLDGITSYDRIIRNREPL